MSEEQQAPEPQTYDCTVRVCKPCIDLEGQECHTPDCIFCRRSMAEVKHYLDVMLLCPVIQHENGSEERIVLVPPEPDLSPVANAPEQLIDEVQRVRGNMSNELLEAFRDTAIKAHIGFKHDGPWDNCGWIECEDRRKIIAAASHQPPSPQSEPIGPTIEALETAERLASPAIGKLKIPEWRAMVNEIAAALTAAQSKGAEHPYGPCGYLYCDWPDGELRCNEPRANPASMLNLLTALEHQAHRNHEFHPAECGECAVTETIANKLREQLGLEIRAAKQP